MPGSDGIRLPRTPPPFGVGEPIRDAGGPCPACTGGGGELLGDGNDGAPSAPASNGDASQSPERQSFFAVYADSHSFSIYGRSPGLLCEPHANSQLPAAVHLADPVRTPGPAAFATNALHPSRGAWTRRWRIEPEVRYRSRDPGRPRPVRIEPARARSGAWRSGAAAASRSLARELRSGFDLRSEICDPRRGSGPGAGRGWLERSHRSDG